MRCGLVGIKVGMSCRFTALGRRIAVTLVKVENCVVSGVKTEDGVDGYNAIQVSYGSSKNVKKPQAGILNKLNIAPRRYTKEFRVSKGLGEEIGKELTADHFKVGQYIDAVGWRIGRGFAGGMKRYGFKGSCASHGVSLTHRAIGSTGNRHNPGRVYKGKRMPGQMGGNRVTMQNLRVLGNSDGLLVIKGSLPGADGSMVLIKDSIKII